MYKITKFSLFVLVTQMCAAQNPVCRQAKMADVGLLRQLMEKTGGDHLAMRYLEDAVTKGRFFVATQNDGAQERIVACQTLFVASPTEAHEILRDELHCLGDDRELQQSGDYPGTEFTVKNQFSYDAENDISLYVGAGFSAEKRTAVEKALLTKAIALALASASHEHTKKRLLFMYGDRTKHDEMTEGIHSALRTLMGRAFPIESVLYKYRTVAPSFNRTTATGNFYTEEPRESMIGCILALTLGGAS